MTTWLEAELYRARELRREGARRGVSSYSGGYNDGWVEALERVQSQLNVERNQAMPTTVPKTFDFFKMLKVIGEVMTDLPTLEAMAKGLAQGKMPTPAEIALLIKLIEDVKAAA